MTTLQELNITKKILTLTKQKLLQYGIDSERVKIALEEIYVIQENNNLQHGIQDPTQNVTQEIQPGIYEIKNETLILIESHNNNTFENDTDDNNTKYLEPVDLDTEAINVNKVDFKKDTLPDECNQQNVEISDINETENIHMNNLRGEHEFQNCKKNEIIEKIDEKPGAKDNTQLIKETQVCTEKDKNYKENETNEKREENIKENNSQLMNPAQEYDTEIGENENFEGNKNKEKQDDYAKKDNLQLINQTQKDINYSCVY